MLRQYKHRQEATLVFKAVCNRLWPISPADGLIAEQFCVLAEEPNVQVVSALRWQSDPQIRCLYISIKLGVL